MQWVKDGIITAKREKSDRKASAAHNCITRGAEFAGGSPKIPAWFDGACCAAGHNTTLRKSQFWPWSRPETWWESGLLEMTGGSSHRHISPRFGQHSPTCVRVCITGAKPTPCISRLYILNKVKAILHQLWAPDSGWSHDLAAWSVRQSIATQPVLGKKTK